jgi:hypothetical protein
MTGSIRCVTQLLDRLRGLVERPKDLTTRSHADDDDSVLSSGHRGGRDRAFRAAVQDCLWLTMPRLAGLARRNAPFRRSGRSRTRRDFRVSPDTRLFRKFWIISTRSPTLEDRSMLTLVLLSPRWIKVLRMSKDIATSRPMQARALADHLNGMLSVIHQRYLDPNCKRSLLPTELSRCARS